MAEVRHTCTAAQTAAKAAIPCPGCQAHFEKLLAKEREVLDAAVTFAEEDDDRQTRDRLLSICREYAALKRESTLG